MSLQQADRRGLAEEAADRVRDAIFAGHFPPGSALREVELAASLGVSRGSVREGLGLLEREGLIRTAWHRGTRVVDVTPTDVQEVYAVRAALDRLAATTARHAATANQLAELEALVDAMAIELTGPAGTAGAGADGAKAGRPGADAAGGPRLVALDMAFHDAVYAAAGNGRLSQAWFAVRSQVHLFQLRRVALSLDHYRSRVVAEHRELARLLREGDDEALARVAEEHVHSAREGLLADLAKP